MRVLVFSSLFPNRVDPQHGVFIKERAVNVSRNCGCEMKVVAPVPWFPSMPFGRSGPSGRSEPSKRSGILGKYGRYSQVPRSEMVEGLEVFHPRYFLVPRIGMSCHGWSMYLSARSLLRRMRRGFDFDLIDAHYVYPDGYAAVLLGQWLNKPVVVSARGSDINQFSAFPRIRRLLQRTLDRAQGVIAVSEGLKAGMVQLGVPAEKIALIPNGVDGGKFYPIDRQEARRRLNLPDRRILLSVGGLKPVKGFDYLIRALKILAVDRRMEDVMLYICGSGESRKDLESLAARLNLQDRVFFRGSIPHEELNVWYSAADLFCLASIREGCPNVLLEALACGLPAVATPVGGIPEILCSEDYGMLAARDDRELADAIQAALGKRWDKSKILASVQARPWAAVAGKVFDVFRSALDARGASPPAAAGAPARARSGEEAELEDQAARR